MPTSLASAAVQSSLVRFIDDVRAFAPVAGEAMPFHWLPDGRMALVFRVLQRSQQTDVAVLGPHSRTLFKRPGGIARVLLLRLKPGWSASLLGVPASALTNRIVPLEELWGRDAEDLAHAFLLAQDTPALLQQVARVMADRRRGSMESSSARLARRAAHLLEFDAVGVEQVAQQLGVTARHLRRAFAECIGVGPKAFARGARLRRAVQLATTSRDWARVASEAGYYDQSHLIGDFQRLVGLTPGAFLKACSAG